MTFTNPAERGKAFGAYGAIAGADGGIGLLLGGVLTEYLSWRWCLYVNVIFSLIAVTAAVRLLRKQPRDPGIRLDPPGIVLVGAGPGLVFGCGMNTATYGAAPGDAGVASAMVNTCQQVGGSIGTALLNTIAASALASYLVAHGNSPAAVANAAVHSYVVAFWVSAAIFAGAAVVCGLVPRRWLVGLASPSCRGRRPALAASWDGRGRNPPPGGPGEGVILGRGAAVVLGKDRGFHVRLDGPPGLLHGDRLNRDIPRYCHRNSSPRTISPRNHP